MKACHVLAVALVSSSTVWPCVVLLWWLWRHRHVTAVRGKGRKAKAGKARERAKSEDIRKKLLYLCAHLDGAGCRTVAHVFNRWHGGWITIGKTSVREFMREHEAQIRERRRQRKRYLPRFVPVGQMWALDLTFIRSPFGTSFTVLGIIDAGSRKLLRLERLPTKCAFVILGHVLIAMGTYGLPKVIRTDNESMFTSKLWLTALKALGVAHRRGPPCQPWRNGRIELFFGTMKTALRGMCFETTQALQEALDRFTCWYNDSRPHQGLDGLVPGEVWQGTTKADLRRVHQDRRHAARVRCNLARRQGQRCRSGR